MTESTLNDLISLRKKSIDENLKEIRENINTAAQKNGRNFEDIHLMAVTKTVEPVFINYAIDLGIDLIGENKVQEYLLKKDELHLEGVQKHLIGHLQTNKVKKIIPHIDMVQSVDSVNVVREISKQSGSLGINSQVLVEINIGDDRNKTGLDRVLIDECIAEISEMENITVKGLMSVPPICEDKKILLNMFEDMYKLFIDIKGKKQHNIDMDILSMGMSGDYELAIEGGSNLVRIGSALFGMRNYR